MASALHVLVVDDNPQDRRLVVHEVRKAYPDAKFSEAVNQSQFDARMNQQAMR